MAQTVAILGRQPVLGKAELESLYGADALQPLGNTAALINIEPAHMSIDRLGGVIKLGKLLAELPFTDWQKITDYLVEHVPKHTCCYGPGKLTFGISAYDFKINPRTINATALSVKKAVKATGRPVRVVPNKEPELSSAQVLHNNMTDLPLGMELLLIAAGQRTILAQTVAVQDIQAYAARDQKRPKRDARVGMLPPKLAQIIINLAHPKPDATLLDPFCGTGVILQEASLMGYRTYGTDIDERMVRFTKDNLSWLQAKTGKTFDINLEVADACTHTWPHSFDTIAAETYLGRPLASLPAPEKLAEIIQNVDTIHKKFLQNVARQTQSGFRFAIAVPTWHAMSGFRHLPVLDSLRDLGYTRVNFVHAPWGKLVYHRPGQIVARELVVLERR